LLLEAQQEIVLLVIHTKLDLEEPRAEGPFPCKRHRGPIIAAAVNPPRMCRCSAATDATRAFTHEQANADNARHNINQRRVIWWLSDTFHYDPYYICTVF
jgi:hypothetical protein